VGRGESNTVLDEAAKETGRGLGIRGWRKQRDSDGAEVAERGGIGRKQQQRQQLPLSGRLAVIMRNKLPL